jgi:hypothetical protein
MVPDDGMLLPKPVEAMYMKETGILYLVYFFGYFP